MSINSLAFIGNKDKKKGFKSKSLVVEYLLDDTQAPSDDLFVFSSTQMGNQRAD